MLSTNTSTNRQSSASYLLVTNSNNSAAPTIPATAIPTTVNQSNRCCNRSIYNQIRSIFHSSKNSIHWLIVLILFCIGLVYIIINWINPHNEQYQSIFNNNLLARTTTTVSLPTTDYYNLLKEQRSEMLAAVISSSTSNKGTHTVQSKPKPTTLIDLHPPLSRATLGHSSWALLHTIAALYPSHPSTEQQNYAHSLIYSLSALYPCTICAKHFRHYIEQNPVKVHTATEFQLWLCEAHNSVNRRTGKPQFDCSTVQKYWPPHLAEDCGCDKDTESTSSDNNDNEDSESSKSI